MRKLRSEMTLRERKILERPSVSVKWFFFGKNYVRFNKIIVSKKWRKEDDPEWEKLNETKREKTEENEIHSFRKEFLSRPRIIILNIVINERHFNLLQRRDPNDQIYSSRFHVRIYSSVSTDPVPSVQSRPDLSALRCVVSHSCTKSNFTNMLVIYFCWVMSFPRSYVLMSLSDLSVFVPFCPFSIINNISTNHVNNVTVNQFSK